MQRCVAVRFGAEVVYAVVASDGPTTRLRVSADECDRLDLFAGRQLWLAVGDGGQVAALVTGVVRHPPFVWVAVEFAAARRAG